MHFRIAIIVITILFNGSMSCHDFCDEQYYNSDGNVLVEKTLNYNNTLYLLRNQTALGKPRLLQWNYKELDMEPIEADAPFVNSTSGFSYEYLNNELIFTFSGQNAYKIWKLNSSANEYEPVDKEPIPWILDNEGKIENFGSFQYPNIRNITNVFSAIVHVKGKHMLVGVMNNKLYYANTQSEDQPLKWRVITDKEFQLTAAFNVDDKSYFIGGNKMYEVMVTNDEPIINDLETTTDVFFGCTSNSLSGWLIVLIIALILFAVAVFYVCVIKRRFFDN